MKTTHIDSAFPVDLTLHKDGRITLTDLRGDLYEVRSKDNALLDEDAYNLIVEGKMGFLEIAHEFLLLVQDLPM